MPDAARLLLPRLLAGGWRDLPFVPFRAGIEIHRIYGDGIAGPAAAVLRYRPGAGVPCHEHEGFEHVVVLEGSQEDERGSYPAGTLAIKPARVAPQRAEPRRLHCAFDLGAAGALHRAGGRGPEALPSSFAWRRPAAVRRPVAPVEAALLRPRRRVTTPCLMRAIHRVEGCRSGRTGRSRKRDTHTKPLIYNSYHAPIQALSGRRLGRIDLPPGTGHSV